ncbi:ribonuclease [Salpingoeca rosetta]|uniref:Ribonuclease n=1 Tax=Salpingoeca rosetta (strain ATCC 50818 / BSB-021) TaxID=946362 RepID=F2UII9_SALR5|nr:ribonuclease [Salpingoeca rosetta]EGD77038.1 ribonuclease [Salpingoeca rosetta]|eukprot:XP_004990878.1 ribonuclease [Salpingoeca rosetta]
MNGNGREEADAAGENHQDEADAMAILFEDEQEADVSPVGVRTRSRTRRKQDQAEGIVQVEEDEEEEEEGEGDEVVDDGDEVVVTETTDPDGMHHIDVKVHKHATATNRDSVIIECDIPEVCKQKPCILGVDEAGRGPVCGPMVYGVAFAPKPMEKTLKNMGFTDSKVVKEEERERLFTEMKSGSLHGKMGWKVHSLSPNTISTGMLARQKYSLNELSHDTCIGLIRRCLDQGVNLEAVYVDTVGPDTVYQAKLQGIFPQLKITVSKKADSKYVIVSAASICAKVVRDHVLSAWRHPERIGANTEYGCGYPSDPKTKAWLRANIDKVFGFPSVVRFSWQTAQTLLDKHAAAVTWEDDDDDEEGTAMSFSSNNRGGANPTKRSKMQQTTLFGELSATKRKFMKSHVFYRQAGLCTTEEFGKNV